ncbi:MAG: Re/Si-specific NAD(P)(+) transhydrogenase subunit alpha [Nitrospirae bacterium]|nr:Re/Si-specific NAD(P)(+) transhydrogenase subunit alpha [Nitrospirota bacterium]
MKIGIPRETAAGERRVAATAETVRKAVAMGFEVLVESGAGTNAAVPDPAYVEAGARIVRSAAELYGVANVILAVQPPDDDALAAMAPDAVVIGMLQPLDRPERVRAFAKRGITALALELLPRITRAQTMDVLSSQSNIAGYGSVLLAATRYGRLFPMMMTAAGTIVAARMLVLGAGVAGLQAIATGRRLGAVVSAYDVRPEVKEQVQSLGARFVEVGAAGEAGASTGTGYAGEMSDAYKAREREVLAAQVAKTDVVISTALIPGRPAPRLISADMVAAMRPGAVIVDLAAANGGNCELTRADEVVTHGGVTLIGTLNLPALWAGDASHLFARNLMAFIEPMVDKASRTLKVDPADEIVGACLLTRGGRVVHPRFAEKETS